MSDSIKKLSALAVDALLTLSVYNLKEYQKNDIVMAQALVQSQE